ncbi:hypothetical protein [Neobacillus drentensis]|uniref:hypothetical protein n=1 Tax=Neobacillus drentensis TaxID=220684 RepID=UPI002FFF0D99
MKTLKDIVDILAMLIGAGVRVRGDPTGALSAEEAHRTARAWSGNQHASITQPQKKRR